METLTIDIAYKISIGILLISSLISSLELISVPSLYLNFVCPSTSIRLKNTLWQAVHYAQFALAAFTGLCFYLACSNGFRMGLIALALVTLYSYYIRKAGKDGSDQLRILALLSFSLCFLLDGDYARVIPLCFIGAQVLIGYATSGIAKVTSSHWRKGDVLSNIFQTYSYGIPKFAKILKKYPRLDRVMSYFAIFCMLAVPLSFMLPYPEPLVITLGMIACFHLSTAILMGLNDFLFTFPLGYPGIILLHSFIFKC